MHPATSFSRPGTIDFQESPDGFTRFRVRSPLFEAEFATQGAHLLRFSAADGHPLLFLSAHTSLTPGKAIRGGIPVIFPWFGPREGDTGSPMHGLVRTRPWEIESIQVAPDGTGKVVFSLASSPETIQIWPHPFHLRMTFTLGQSLEIDWEVHNTGPAPFRFEQALHPYFSVRDVFSTSVTGLEGSHYLDKADGLRWKQDQRDSVEFRGETDRLYVDTTGACVLRDVAAGRELRITKEHSASSVVWNPWSTKAASLADLGNEEWREFVCVEQANANRNAIELPSGKTHFFHVRYASQSVSN